MLLEYTTLLHCCNPRFTHHHHGVICSNICQLPAPLLIRYPGLEMNQANRAAPEPSRALSSSKCNTLMHKNIHFGFNWCVASHLCSTQINSKSSKSRKFVCYEPLLKFPEHQFLCSVSVRRPRASRALSMLGSFPGLCSTAD